MAQHKRIIRWNSFQWNWLIQQKANVLALIPVRDFLALFFNEKTLPLKSTEEYEQDIDMIPPHVVIEITSDAASEEYIGTIVKRYGGQQALRMSTNKVRNILIAIKLVYYGDPVPNLTMRDTPPFWKLHDKSKKCYHAAARIKVVDPHVQRNPTHYTPPPEEPLVRVLEYWGYGTNLLFTNPPRRDYPQFISAKKISFVFDQAAPVSHIFMRMSHLLLREGYPEGTGPALIRYPRQRKDFKFTVVTGSVNTTQRDTPVFIPLDDWTRWHAQAARHRKFPLV